MRIDALDRLTASFHAVHWSRTPSQGLPDCPGRLGKTPRGAPVHEGGGLAASEDWELRVACKKEKSHELSSTGGNDGAASPYAPGSRGVQP